MGISFKTVYLETNQGHGNARRQSLVNCSYDFVALMDADDISVHNRFEKQLERFTRNPELSIVGGQITEFIGEPQNIIGKREVPQTDCDIKNYMRKRCPMNQVSVMFKKADVEESGGYIDWYCEEDYYLWIRMAQKGCHFANVPDVLVNVRVGNEMSARRGGWKYFSSEARLQAYMYKNKLITLPQYLYNVGIRFGGEVVVPTSLRTKLFRLMRNTYDGSVEKEHKKEELQCNKREYPPFSVAMCVYGGDNPKWFDVALESVVKQTVQPHEVVIVVDGPIPENLQSVIDKYCDSCNSKERV